jgi:transposase
MRKSWIHHILPKEQHWQENLRKQEHSGLSIRDYCHREGIKESAFYRWRQKLRPCQGELSVSRPSPEKARFLPVRITSEKNSWDGGVELQFGKGRRIKVRPGFDRQTLIELLAVLEECGC